MNGSGKKRLSPTIGYLFTGLTACAVGFGVSAASLSTWSESIAGTPVSLAAIHTLVLGGLLTIAAGVLFQVVSIAFQAPPLPRHVALWHLPIHAVSVVMMVLGFALGDWRLVGAGGVLLTAGLIAYGAFLAKSYRLARNKTHVHRLLWLPAAFFAWVVAAGLWQAFSPATETPSLLLTHVAAGSLGFWVGLVMIISYKFIPMFTLSHGYEVSSAKTAAWWFGGLAAVIISQAPAIFTWGGGLAPATQMLMRALTVAGCLASFAGIMLFAADAWRVLAARKRRALVKPMRSALLALSVALVAASLALAAISFDSRRSGFLAGFLLLFGGLLPLAFSYVQKIVPFLWFEYRFSHRPERKTAPGLDEMVPANWIATAAWLYAASFASGLARMSGWLPRSTGLVLSFAFGGCGVLSVATLMLALYRVLRIGGPRPTD